MYKINYSSHFSAAHRLIGYDGACRDLHGHNWKVRVCLGCENTDEIGLTIDFNIVKKILNKLMEELDHKYLNELTAFRDLNPTSENIAKFIYQEFKQRTNDLGADILEVEVWESDKSSIIYYE